jgi:hypothetical protein
LIAGLEENQRNVLAHSTGGQKNGKRFRQMNATIVETGSISDTLDAAMPQLSLLPTRQWEDLVQSLTQYNTYYPPLDLCNLPCHIPDTCGMLHSVSTQSMFGSIFGEKEDHMPGHIPCGPCSVRNFHTDPSLLHGQEKKGGGSRHSRSSNRQHFSYIFWRLSIAL